jgi:hypothetical protein
MTLINTLLLMQFKCKLSRRRSNGLKKKQCVVYAMNQKTRKQFAKTGLAVMWADQQNYRR